MADPVVKLRINLESAGAQRALEQLNRSEAFDRLRESVSGASQAFVTAQARVVELRTAIQNVKPTDLGAEVLTRDLKDAERAAEAARKRISQLANTLRESRASVAAAPGASNVDVSATLRQQANLAQARQSLGVRDTQAVRAEIERLTQSYTLLRTSGAASTAELSNAARALRQRVADLNLELAGKGTGGAGSFLTDRLAAFAAPTAIIAGLIGVTSQIVRTNTEFDNLDQKLKAVFGSSAAANEEFAFSTNTANRLGLDIKAVAEGYSTLAAAAKGTALEGKQTRDVFSAVAEASGKLHLSTDQTSGALLAISQIISKGTVSAEELRGQLGERIPGAFQIAARAIGVTTEQLDKLLREGALSSADFLPKFAAELRKTFGTNATTLVDSTQSNFARLRNEISLLAKDIGGPLVSALSAASGAAASGLKSARKAREEGNRTTFEDGSSAVLFRGIPIETQGPQTDFSRAVPFRDIGQAFRPGALLKNVRDGGDDNAVNLFSKQVETKAVADLREKLALTKARTEEEKVLYQITVGGLKNASNLEKNLALQIARTQDQQAAAGSQRKQSSAADVSDYERQRAAVASLSSVLSAANTLASTQLDTQFRQNLIGYEDYYRQRASLQQQANQQDIQQRQAELAALNGQASAVRSGPDAKSAETVRKLAEIESSRIKIQSDINALKIKSVEIDQQANTSISEASLQAEQRLNDIRQQIAQQQRDAEGVAQTTRVRLEQQFAQDLLGPKAATFRGFIDTQVTQAQFDTVKQQAADLTSSLQNQFATLSQGVQAGTITTAQAQSTFAAALAQTTPNLQTLLAQLRELAAKLGPDAAQSVDQITGSLQGLALQAQSPFDRLLATWQDTTSQLQNASTQWAQSFTDQLTNLATGGKFRFKDFANSVISDLARIGIQKAFSQLFGAGGGGGNLFGGVASALGFNSGGAVRGPGGPTEDKVPAMLSNGEYVIRAAAVQQFGVPFLDAINSSRRRSIAAFAAGGLVGSAPTGVGGFGAPTISVTNNYDFRGAGPDQVQQLLQYGEKIKNETKREIFDAIKRRTAPTK